MDLQKCLLPASLSRRVAMLCSIAIALSSGCAKPQYDDLKKFVKTSKASSPQVKLEPPPQIEDYVPFTYTAQGLKDPFVPSSFAQQPEEELPTDIAAPEVIDSGIHPDPNRPREELEKYSLGSLKMVGTFNQDGGLWALIKAPDGIIHRVREGNYLGADRGRITAISEQRIDLKEIVREGDSRWMERDAFLSLAE
jgi:type IV pilus assembly protein PilP